MSHRVTKSGSRHGRKVDMGRDRRMIGLKFRSFGYKSMGDSVPECICSRERLVHHAGETTE